MSKDKAKTATEQEKSLSDEEIQKISGGWSYSMVCPICYGNDLDFNKRSMQYYCRECGNSFR